MTVMVDMFFAACPRVGDKDLNLHVIVCVHDQPCMFIAIPSGSCRLRMNLLLPNLRRIHIHHSIKRIELHANLYRFFAYNEITRTSPGKIC